MLTALPFAWVDICVFSPVFFLHACIQYTSYSCQPQQLILSNRTLSAHHKYAFLLQEQTSIPLAELFDVDQVITLVLALRLSCHYGHYISCMKLCLYK